MPLYLQVLSRFVAAYSRDALSQHGVSILRLLLFKMSDPLAMRQLLDAPDGSLKLVKSDTVDNGSQVVGEVFESSIIG